MLIEKILTTVQKIINKKEKSQSAWVLGELARLFWAFMDFIVLGLYGLYSSHTYLTSGRQIGAPAYTNETKLVHI
jgi:hypothetical protein